MPKPGPFVCISSYDKRLDNDISVALGQLVQVYIVFDDGWCLGKNLSSDSTGVIPITCLCEVEPALAAEMMQNYDSITLDQLKEDDSIKLDQLKEDAVDDSITLEHLNELSMQIEPHSLDTSETTLYFVFKSTVAESVLVWGNFNDWSTPMPLYWEQGSSSFIGFVESDCLNHGSLCIYKFIVDDEVTISQDFPTILHNDDLCNYFIVSSKSSHISSKEINGSSKEISDHAFEGTSGYPQAASAQDPDSPMVITLRELEVANSYETMKSPTAVMETKNTQTDDPDLGSVKVLGNYRLETPQTNNASSIKNVHTANILDPNITRTIKESGVQAIYSDSKSIQTIIVNTSDEKSIQTANDSSIQTIKETLQTVKETKFQSSHNQNSSTDDTSISAKAKSLIGYSILLPLVAHLAYFYQVDLFVYQMYNAITTWHPFILGGFALKLGVTGVVLALLTWQFEKLLQ